MANKPKTIGKRTGYATLGGVPLSEDEALEFNQNLVSGYDPMAEAITHALRSARKHFDDGGGAEGGGEGESAYARVEIRTCLRIRKHLQL